MGRSKSLSELTDEEYHAKLDKMRDHKREVGQKNYHGKRVLTEEVRAARRASMRIHLLIKAGVLARPVNCPDCGSDKHRILAKHPFGYENDEIKWTCSECDGYRRRRSKVPNV